MYYFLIKVFTDKLYAEKFLQGEIYAQRLSRFKCLEGDEERGDDFEGAIVYPPGSRLELEGTDPETEKVSKWIVLAKEIVNLRHQPHYFDNFNVFCTYAVDDDDLEKVPNDNFETRRKLQPGEKLWEFGEHAVAILNVDSFVRRTKEAARRQGYSGWHGHVTYYDSDAGTPYMEPGMWTLFAKRRNFAHQKEFRVAIDTNTTGCNPITLNIGDIRDIAVYFHKDDLNHKVLISIVEGPTDIRVEVDRLP